MIGRVTIFSLSRPCLAALTHAVYVLVIWSGFGVFQDGGGTSTQVTRSYDSRVIRDPKNVIIRISVVGDAFHFRHFTLNIYGSGIVEFYGHSNTFVPGLHRSQLSEAEVMRLAAAFEEADFYSLHDESDLIVFDAPRTTIELTADGYRKPVTDRWGESKAFRTLVDRILEISHAQLWLQDTPDTLQAILADSKNLNTADDGGRSVLMWACHTSNLAAVRELIDAGADVRAKDNQGRTVLMYAAARQSPEIVEALLHSRADLNEKDSAGETAVHFSAGLATFERPLFGSIADYTEPPTASFWPYYFPREPNPEVLAHLLDAGADPNAVDFDGATPLMYAAGVGTLEVLRSLLASGADFNAQDAKGRTALMYAADHCETESARLLVQSGANVMLKDSNGHTALERVRRKPSKFSWEQCRTSREQIIRILRVGHLGQHHN